VAAATVLHFGRDDHQHVKVLRNAGYEVCEVASLNVLRRYLKQDGSALVVMVEEGARRTTEQAAAVVRENSGAPLILFRRFNTPLDLKRFDRIYASSVPAPFWLYATAVLVEQSRTLRAYSEWLRIKAKDIRSETEAVCAETKRQLVRAAEEIERHREPAKLWHELTDDSE